MSNPSGPISVKIDSSKTSSIHDGSTQGLVTGLVNLAKLGLIVVISGTEISIGSDGVDTPAERQKIINALETYCRDNRLSGQAKKDFYSKIAGNLKFISEALSNNPESKYNLEVVQRALKDTKISIDYIAKVDTTKEADSFIEILIEGKKWTPKQFEKTIIDALNKIDLGSGATIESITSNDAYKALKDTDVSGLWQGTERIIYDAKKKVEGLELAAKTKAAQEEIQKKEAKKTAFSDHVKNDPDLTTINERLGSDGKIGGQDYTVAEISEYLQISDNKTVLRDKVLAAVKANPSILTSLNNLAPLVLDSGEVLVAFSDKGKNYAFVIKKETGSWTGLPEGYVAKDGTDSKPVIYRSGKTLSKGLNRIARALTPDSKEEKLLGSYPDHRILATVVMGSSSGSTGATVGLTSSSSSSDPSIPAEYFRDYSKSGKTLWVWRDVDRDEKIDKGEEQHSLTVYVRGRDGSWIKIETGLNDVNFDLSDAKMNAEASSVERDGEIDSGERDERERMILEYAGYYGISYEKGSEAFAKATSFFMVSRKALREARGEIVVKSSELVGLSAEDARKKLEALKLYHKDIIDVVIKSWDEIKDSADRIAGKILSCFAAKKTGLYDIFEINRDDLKNMIPYNNEIYTKEKLLEYLRGGEVTKSGEGKKPEEKNAMDKNIRSVRMALAQRDYDQATDNLISILSQLRENKSEKVSIPLGDKEIPECSWRFAYGYFLEQFLYAEEGGKIDFSSLAPERKTKLIAELDSYLTEPSSFITSEGKTNLDLVKQKIRIVLLVAGWKKDGKEDPSAIQTFIDRHLSSVWSLPIWAGHEKERGSLAKQLAEFKAGLFISKKGDNFEVASGLNIERELEVIVENWGETFVASFKTQEGDQQSMNTTIGLSISTQISLANGKLTGESPTPPSQDDAVAAYIAQGLYGNESRGATIKQKDGDKLFTDTKESQDENYKAVFEPGEKKPSKPKKGNGKGAVKDGKDNKKGKTGAEKAGESPSLPGVPPTEEKKEEVAKEAVPTTITLSNNISAICTLRGDKITAKIGNNERVVAKKKGDKWVSDFHRYGLGLGENFRIELENAINSQFGITIDWK